MKICCGEDAELSNMHIKNYMCIEPVSAGKTDHTLKTAGTQNPWVVNYRG
jgi:hypothetical protein